MIYRVTGILFLLKMFKSELDISKVMVASCSILTGSPFIIILNNDNKIDEAVLNIVKVLSRGNEVSLTWS